MANTIPVDIQLKLNKQVTKDLDKVTRQLNDLSKKNAEQTKKANQEVAKSSDKVADSLQRTSKATDQASSSFSKIIKIAERVAIALAFGFLKNVNFVEDFGNVLRETSAFIVKSIKNILKIVKDFARAILTGNFRKAFKELRNLHVELANGFLESQQLIGKAADAFGGEFKIEGTFDEFRDAIKDRIFRKIAKSLQEVAEITTIVSGTILSAFGPRVTKAFSRQTTVVRGLTAAFNETGKSVKSVGGFIADSRKFFVSLTGKAFSLTRNFFGLIENAGTLGALLVGLSEVLKQSEKQYVRVSGVIAGILGFALLGLSLGLSKLILLAGDAALFLGDKLTKAAISAANAFIEADKAAFVFNRTITGFNKVFGDAIGTAESWRQTIAKINLETNGLVSGLDTAATEIVATTSALGFNEAQQKKLLQVTTDYSVLLKEDVLKTTLAFISGLNGNAQAVQKYGVKLGESAVQQKLFAKGLLTNFKSLSLGEKSQARFNALLSQYNPIAGLAADVSTTLAGQQKILKNNQDRLNIAFGKGAALIEDNGLASAALNVILGNVSDEILATTGFLGALAGRILTVIGTILKFSFTVFFATKVIKLLNFALSTNFLKTAFGATIPLLEQSVIQLIQSLGVANVRLGSTTQVLQTALSALVNGVRLVLGNILGLRGAAITFSAIIRASVVKSLALFRFALIGVGRAMFALAANPVALTIGVVVALLVASKDAIAAVEKRTGALSAVWNFFRKVLAATSPFIELILKQFKNLGEFFKDLAGKVVGRLVVVFNTLFTLLIKFIKLNPFKVFGDVDTKELDIALSKMKKFDNELIAVDFNIRKVKLTAENGFRSIAGAADKVDLGKLIEQIQKLQGELKSIGEGDIREVQKQQRIRLNLVKLGQKNRVLSEKASAKLIVKINQDASNKIFEIRKKEQERIQALFDKGAQDPGGGLLDLVIGNIELPKFDFGGSGSFFDDISKGFKNLSVEGKAALAGIVSGLVGALGQGAAGAEQVIAGLGEGAITLLTGSKLLGKIGGQLISIFAKGPEEVRKTITEFTKAIPDIIKNIILSIPVFIETLIVGLIDAFIEVASNADVIIERLILAWIKAIPRILGRLALVMPQIAIQFSFALIRSVPKIIGALVREAPKFVTALIKSIVSGGGLFGGGKSGGGGIGGSKTGGIGGTLTRTVSTVFGSVGKVFGSIGKIFGFADGGMIGKVPSGFANDGFLSGLTSGELVIDRSLTGKLQNFLDRGDRQQSTGGGSDSETMRKILFALQQPQQIEASITNIDKSAFGKMMLGVSRTNRRTT